MGEERTKENDDEEEDSVTLIQAAAYVDLEGRLEPKLKRPWMPGVRVLDFILLY